MGNLRGMYVPNCSERSSSTAGGRTSSSTSFASLQVTVVGVHSAKFDNEKDTDAIREAVLRYDVLHPVSPFGTR